MVGVGVEVVVEVGVEAEVEVGVGVVVGVVVEVEVEVGVVVEVGVGVEVVVEVGVEVVKKNNKENGMDISQLTLAQVQEIKSLFRGSCSTRKTRTHSYEIGAAYLIRTATMYYTGRIRAITSTDIVLTDAAWIADTGRFSDALKTGTLNEIEPFLNPVIVSRGGIIDATIWNHPLPREKK